MRVRVVDSISTFVLKIASRCNLNCSYCYVYNKADTSWTDRPALMPLNVYSRAIDRIAEYCRASGRTTIGLTFHGGEPTLVGSHLLDRFIEMAREKLHFLNRIRFSIQTNAVALQPQLIDVLSKHRVSVGVSIDGDKTNHDLHRVDYRGRGTYHRVRKNVGDLLQRGLDVGALCVIPLGCRNPAEFYDSLRALNCSSIDYLIPDVGVAEHERIVQQYGRLPLYEVAGPLFDHWIARDRGLYPVRLFRSIVRLILGGSAQTDIFGKYRASYLFIETDGTFEPLDVLRICANGITRTKLNVVTHSVGDCTRDPGLLGASLTGGFDLPAHCRSCDESNTCAGGYLPHRYRDGPLTNGKNQASLFGHSSIWCTDLKAMFWHAREVLKVDIWETERRKLLFANKELWASSANQSD